MIKVFPIVDTFGSWYPKNSFEVFKRHTQRIKFVDSPRHADAIWIMSYYMSIKCLQYPRLLGKLMKFLPEKRISSHLQGKYIMASFHHLTPWKVVSFRKKLSNLTKITRGIQEQNIKRIIEVVERKKQFQTLSIKDIEFRYLYTNLVYTRFKSGK